MAACDATIQSLAFAAETAGSYNATTATGWGEDIDTMTYGVQLCAPVEFSGITHEMIAPERVTARRLEGTKGIPGAFSNLTLSFSSYLTGHGSATTGAITLNALYVLMGRALGGAVAAASTGTTLTGGSATIPATTSSSTSIDGSVVRIGALGDGDGNGQFYLVDTHSTTLLTLLNNMDGAPINGAVLYNAALAYAASSSCSLDGTRMRIQSADMQFVLHGGFPTSITFSGLGPGEVPKVNQTWQFSWAEPVAGTFPTTPTADAFSPSPNTADGSVHFQTVGTATRALLNLRALSVDCAISVMPIMGGTGPNAYQTITGATRGRDRYGVSMVVDAEGADATPTYWDEWLTNPFKMLVVTLNSKATQSVGIVCRNLVYAGARPSQSNTGGRNTVPLRFEAIASTTTTSDLTMSPLILAGS